MKAAFRDIPLKPIYAAYAGNTPIKSIWKGDKKIWPDNSQRVTRIWLDMAALTETQRVYWNLALQNITAGASASRFVRLVASRTYNIGRTYGNFALATHEGNGCISFPAGTGPLANEVVAGKKVNIRMVMPSCNSAGIKGTSSLTFPPSGTQARMYWGKWQKKVSATCQTTITSMPSETELANVRGQSHGHSRYSQDWLVHTFGDAIAGDTYISITSYSPNTSDYQAYLVYPAFDITITPTILRTETTTIEP